MSEIVAESAGPAVYDLTSRQTPIGVNERGGDFLVSLGVTSMGVALGCSYRRR